jgi:hypothetical protein
MKDLLFVIMIMTGVILLTMLTRPKKSVEEFYNFNDFVKNEEVHISKSVYLVSTTKDTIQGSATVYKRLDKKLFTIYCEANLPLAVGGNFTNDNIVYQLYGGIAPSKLELLTNLERSPDGFYKGNFFNGESTRDYYNNMKYFKIFSNDEKGLFPILKGNSV